MLNWLNGKKTTIGAALLLGAVVLDQVVVGVWHYSPWWIGNVSQTLDWSGMLFAGGGLGHKIVKARIAAAQGE